MRKKLAGRLLCTFLTTVILYSSFDVLALAAENGSGDLSECEIVDDSAEDAENEGNFYYTVNGDGTATITGYRGTPSGDLIIPSSIAGCEVTIIDDYAFMNCDGFTGNLVIPDSVMIIGIYAFYGCSGFTGDLVIPGSVKTIGEYAFYACDGFTGSIIISDGVTRICECAFCSCPGFTGDLIIPDSVIDIEDYAFDGCSGLTGILTIPNSITIIKEHAFSACGFTGNLVIPDSVTIIEPFAFKHCSDFTGDLIIPKGVTAIGMGAFYECSGFADKLVIPESVESINESWYSSFHGCSGIKRVDNKSACIIELESLSQGTKWRDLNTNKRVESICQGTAVMTNDFDIKDIFALKFKKNIGKKQDYLSADINPIYKAYYRIRTSIIRFFTEIINVPVNDLT